MVNFDLIIGRIEALKGVSGDKHVAAALGISPQDFSNRKKRGSLLPVIFEWAINENVNLEWLIKGEQNIAAEEAPIYAAIKPVSRRVQSLIDKLTRIIDEGNDKKIKAVEAQLDLLDPGERPTNIIREKPSRLSKGKTAREEGLERVIAKNKNPYAGLSPNQIRKKVIDRKFAEEEKKGQKEKTGKSAVDIAKANFKT